MIYTVLLFKLYIAVGVQIHYHSLHVACSYPISLHPHSLLHHPPPPRPLPQIIFLPSDHNNNLLSTAVITLGTRVLSGFGARPNVVPIISVEMILLPALSQQMSGLMLLMWHIVG